MSRQPTVQLISSPHLRGQTQYLGGSVAGRPGEEKLYFIPGHASQILVLDPKDDSTRLIGPVFPGQYKWLRSVLTPSGVIYGLPCHHSHILKINPMNDDEVTLIPLPEEIASLPWKFHGGTLCPIDNCIYLVPQFSPRVLKIDIQTDTVSLVGPALEGKYKWYGGLRGSDDAIYCIPQCGQSVLRIDPLCRSKVGEPVTLHGDFGSGGWKWHVSNAVNRIFNCPRFLFSFLIFIQINTPFKKGGAVAHKGDAIIGIPCHSNHVLKIEPGPEPYITLEGDDTVVKSGRHQPEHKYKFLGAVTDCEGTSVYCIPSGAERVLRVQVLPDDSPCDDIISRPRYRTVIQEVGE